MKNLEEIDELLPWQHFFRFGGFFQIFEDRNLAKSHL